MRKQLSWLKKPISLPVETIPLSSVRWPPLTLRTGRFTDAIETAQRALQIATAQDNFALANKLEKDLDLYRTNVPLRDFGLTNAH